MGTFWLGPSTISTTRRIWSFGSCLSFFLGRAAGVGGESALGGFCLTTTRTCTCTTPPPPIPNLFFSWEKGGALAVLPDYPDPHSLPSGPSGPLSGASARIFGPRSHRIQRGPIKPSPSALPATILCPSGPLEELCKGRR